MGKVTVTASDSSGKSTFVLANRHTFQAAIRHINRSLLTTFLPARCMGCGILFIPPPVFPAVDEPIGMRAISDNANVFVTDNDCDTGERDVILSPALVTLSQWVCPVCITGWSPVISPMCSICGMPFKSRQGSDHVCGECLQRPKNYKSARAASLYTPLTMGLAHRFKYNHKIQLARLLGTILAYTFMRFWKAEDIDLVVPVPLHPKRFRQRGFNQAYLLAKWFDRQIKKIAQHSTTATVEREAVRRTRPTASQTGLKRKSRFDNIKNAFEVMKPELIDGQRILLIDDIYTTGATVNECAKVLLDSGASRIDVLTVARAV